MSEKKEIDHGESQGISDKKSQASWNPVLPKLVWISPTETAKQVARTGFNPLFISERVYLPSRTSGFHHRTTKPIENKIFHFNSFLS